MHKKFLYLVFVPHRRRRWETFLLNHRLELVFIEEIWYNKNYEKGIQSNKLRK